MFNECCCWGRSHRRKKSLRVSKHYGGPSESKRRSVLHSLLPLNVDARSAAVKLQATECPPRGRCRPATPMWSHACTPSRTYLLQSQGAAIQSSCLQRHGIESSCLQRVGNTSSCLQRLGVESSLPQRPEIESSLRQRHSIESSCLQRHGIAFSFLQRHGIESSFL